MALLWAIKIGGPRKFSIIGLRYFSLISSYFANDTYEIYGKIFENTQYLPITDASGRRGNVPEGFTVYRKIGLDIMKGFSDLYLL